MKRRDFLKVLLAVGAVSVSGLSLLEADDGLLKLRDYPKVTYTKDYILSKMTNLHQMYFDIGAGERFVVSEYYDLETLEPIHINNMLKIVKQKQEEVFYTLKG